MIDLSTLCPGRIIKFVNSDSYGIISKIDFSLKEKNARLVVNIDTGTVYDISIDEFKNKFLKNKSIELLNVLSYEDLLKIMAIFKKTRIDDTPKIIREIIISKVNENYNGKEN